MKTDERREGRVAMQDLTKGIKDWGEKPEDRRGEGSPKIRKRSESPSVVSDYLRPKDHIVHGLLQARILERVAFPFSRGSSHSRD